MKTNRKYYRKQILVILPASLIFLIIGSCSKEPGPLQSPEHVDNSIELFVTKNNVPSDNYSFAEISAIVKYSPTSNDIIVFKTDKGLFSNNSNIYSVSVSSNDTTRAFLKYNKSDIVRVTATIYNKYSKEVYVQFMTSYPTQILVNPDSSSLLPLFTSKSLVKSTLARQVGSVSEGLLVNYYDSIATSSGGSIGTFHNSTFSNSLGEATVEYWLQDTSYHGFVYIKSYIDTGSGRVTGVNKIYIH